MKYYAVIDTNVIVSAFLRWDSVPGKLMDSVFDRKIIPVISTDIISEYKEVLSRKKFSFSKQNISALIDFLNAYAIIINPTHIEAVFTDPDDAKFYEVTMDERNHEEAYLVTGNKRHFPIKPFIVTPREMLEIITNK